jgi:hypothetical protein
MWLRFAKPVPGAPVDFSFAATKKSSSFARLRGPKRLLRAAAVAAFACTAAASHAATTTNVVDIPAADGGTQRFLYVRPDAPIAYIVNFPGGDGNLGIQNDGTMDTRVGRCNPIGRNRAALADRRIGVALIDKTTQGSIYNYENLLAVVRYVRERDDVPVWIAGGSASTSATIFAATQLPLEIPAGVIFNSPEGPDDSVSSIRRPAAVIWHPADPFQQGIAMHNALTAAPVRERIEITGGDDTGCGHHLFNGADADYVNAAAGAIERNNAATGSSATLNMQGITGTWHNPATPGQGFLLEVVPSLSSLVLGWFTWSNTAGDHLWLSGIGPITGNNAAVELIRSSNGRFNDPAPVIDSPAGTATFRFTSCSAGSVTFSRTDTGESGTIPIQRLTPVPAACAEAVID